MILITINFFFSLEVPIQSQLFQATASNKKASGIACSIILETTRDAIPLQLSRICLANGSITLNSGVRNLTNDLCVCNSHDQSVFLGIILVFILMNHDTSSSEIG